MTIDKVYHTHEELYSAVKMNKLDLDESKFWDNSQNTKLKKTSCRKLYTILSMIHVKNLVK